MLLIPDILWACSEVVNCFRSGFSWNTGLWLPLCPCPYPESGSSLASWWGETIEGGTAKLCQDSEHISLENMLMERSKNRRRVKQKWEMETQTAESLASLTLKGNIRSPVKQSLFCNHPHPVESSSRCMPAPTMQPAFCASRRMSDFPLTAVLLSYLSFFNTSLFAQGKLP